LNLWNCLVYYNWLCFIDNDNWSSLIDNWLLDSLIGWNYNLFCNNHLFLWHFFDNWGLFNHNWGRSNSLFNQWLWRYYFSFWNNYCLNNSRHRQFLFWDHFLNNLTLCSIDYNHRRLSSSFFDCLGWNNNLFGDNHFFRCLLYYRLHWLFNYLCHWKFTNMGC